MSPDVLGLCIVFFFFFFWGGGGGFRVWGLGIGFRGV